MRHALPRVDSDVNSKMGIMFPAKVVSLSHAPEDEKKIAKTKSNITVQNRTEKTKTQTKNEKERTTKKQKEVQRASEKKDMKEGT